MKMDGTFDWYLVEWFDGSGSNWACFRTLKSAMRWRDVLEAPIVTVTTVAANSDESVGAA